MAQHQKLELTRVHVYEKLPGRQAFRLAKTQPAMRLASGADIVWIQGGKLFDDGGEPLAKVPGWFAEEVKKINPQALAETGYKAPAK